MPTTPAAAPGGVPRGAAGLALRLSDIRWVFLAAVLVAVFIVGYEAFDPDLFWHIRTGDYILANHAVPTAEMYSYTGTGQPWTPHAWLFEVMLALVYHAGGFVLISIVTALMTWSGFVALTLRARTIGAGPIATAIALAFAAKADETVLGPRTQIATFALLCWVLLLTESQLARGGRRRWLLVPIFLVWANLHAGFLVGLVIIAFTAVVAWLGASGDDRDRVRRNCRELLVALGAAAIAACVNPFGPGLLLFAAQSSQHNFGKLIIEWASPDFHDSSMLPLLLFIAVSLAAMGLAHRRRLMDSALWSLGLVLSLLAVRNIAILVAVGMPAVALWIQSAWDRLGRTARVPIVNRARVIAGAVLVVVVLAVDVEVVAIAAGNSTSTLASSYPVCATAALAAAPPGTRVYAPYGDGGYIILKTWPRVRVFAYGESEALGDHILGEYAAVSFGQLTSPSALALLDLTRTDAVMTPDGDLQTELDRSGQWRRTGVDDHGLRLYVRSGAMWTNGLGRCPA